MEESTKNRKVLPKRRKVVKGDRIKKRGKRSSRKEKPFKNVEKKTRSGCTYSPYEMYLEKSEQTHIMTSNDKHTRPIRAKLTLPRRLKPLCINNSNGFIAVNMHSKEDRIIIESNAINNSNHKLKLNNECKSYEIMKRRNIRQDRRHKNLRDQPPKQGKKRGRKPRLRANAVIAHQNEKQTFSDRSNSILIDMKSLNPKENDVKKYDENSLEDSLKLPIVDNSCPFLFPADISDPDESVEGSKDTKVKENKIMAKVNETSDEIELDSALNKHSLLDLVFPDPDSCHSISDEEIGSCIEYGCASTKLYNEEKFFKKNVKPETLTNCMFTDTDKYVFKSCFKNIQSQIQHFDRYRGAETPGGEASLYDVSEVSPIDSRKLYRKNFSDLKLNMWYNYVYHSAQLARIGGCSFPAYRSPRSAIPFDVQLDDIILKPIKRVGSSCYIPGEYIWKCNYLEGTPSVEEVLSERSSSGLHL